MNCIYCEDCDAYPKYLNNPNEIIHEWKCVSMYAKYIIQCLFSEVLK